MRIVSLLASATEMLFGIGLGRSVVAVSHECDYPAAARSLPKVTASNIRDDVTSSEIDRQVNACVASGEALYEIDSDLLCRLAPDLIVTQAQCDVCAVRYADVMATVASEPRLRQTKVFALNPASLQDVLDEILKLGEMTDSISAAKAFLAALQERIDRVASEVGALPESSRRRVALIEWIEPLMLSGNWMPQIVELAGGLHGLTSPGESSPLVDWSDFKNYDPELIAVMPCGFEVPRTWQEMPLLKAKPGWSELAAVQAGQVFAVDGNAYFNRAGPRLVNSLEILAHLLHPQRFPVPGYVEVGPAVWQKISAE